MFSVIITTVIYQCQEGKIKIIEKNDIQRKDRQRRYTDYDIFKDGKPGCRGAGDSHLPRSMRARSPHGLFPPSAVPPLTDEERSSESRRAQRITSEIPPELSNLILQVLATERIGPLRRGDFVLCTTNLRSWIAADAKHLHHTIFIKTANSVCRGAGDSHLPQPSCSFSRRRFQPLTDEERSSESRRDTTSPQGFRRSSRT